MYNTINCFEKLNNCIMGVFMNNSIYKKGLAVVLIIALFIMTAVGIKLSSKENDINYTNEENSVEKVGDLGNDSELIKYIFVDIDGAVINPGVYRCNEGDRVNDAIMKAGGLKDTASCKNINRARKLVDGEKIYIIELGENVDVTPLYSQGNQGKININTAPKEMLMSLSGIGDVYAGKIIEYRNKKQFTTIEEIKNIQGIGDKIFDKIKDSITVE